MEGCDGVTPMLRLYSKSPFFEFRYRVGLRKNSVKIIVYLNLFFFRVGRETLTRPSEGRLLDLRSSCPLPGSEGSMTR